MPRGTLWLQSLKPDSSGNIRIASITGRLRAPALTSRGASLLHQSLRFNNRAGFTSASFLPVVVMMMPVVVAPVWASAPTRIASVAAIAASPAIAPAVIAVSPAAAITPTTSVVAVICQSRSRRGRHGHQTCPDCKNKRT